MPPSPTTVRKMARSVRRNPRSRCRVTSTETLTCAHFRILHRRFRMGFGNLHGNTIGSLDILKAGSLRIAMFGSQTTGDLKVRSTLTATALSPADGYSVVGRLN